VGLSSPVASGLIGLLTGGFLRLLPPFHSSRRNRASPLFSAYGVVERIAARGSGLRVSMLVLRLKEGDAIFPPFSTPRTGLTPLYRSPARLPQKCPSFPPRSLRN